MKLVRNLDKEGKGISKNAKQKREIPQFFSLIYYHIGSLFKAGLLAVAMSVPIVTADIAEVGLARVTRAAARDKHIFFPSDMTDAIKKNWKQALIIGILDFIFIGFWVADFLLAKFILGGTLSAVLYGISVVGFIIFSFAKFYHPFLIITFKKKVGQIIKESLLLAIVGIKRNIAAGLSIAACYLLAFIAVKNLDITGFMICVILYIVFFRWFRSMIIQFSIFPVVEKYLFDPYYSQHPDEDLEKRYDLGLISADEYFGEESEEEKINFDLMFR